MNKPVGNKWAVIYRRIESQRLDPEERLSVKRCAELLGKPESQVYRWIGRASTPYGPPRLVSHVGYGEKRWVFARDLLLFAYRRMVRDDIDHRSAEAA